MIQSLDFHRRKCHYVCLVTPPWSRCHGPSSDDSGDGHRAHPGQAPGQDTGRVRRGVRGPRPDRQAGKCLQSAFAEPKASNKLKSSIRLRFPSYQKSLNLKVPVNSLWSMSIVHGVSKDESMKS